MEKVIVTGANGFVASHLCRELKNSGYQVIGTVRKNANLDLIKDLDLELVELDLSQKDLLAKCFAGAKYVFHIAALFREAKFADQVYFEVNLEGTRNVLDAACAAQVEKLVYCSTTGVMGDIKNPPATEELPYAPGDVYQISKMEAEKLCLSYFQSGKIRGSVIRPAMIWGPGDRRFLKLFKGIKKGTLPIVGDGKTTFHFIYVTDLARSFRLAAESNDADNNIFIIGGKELVSISRVWELIAKELNVKPLKFKLPLLPLYLIAFLCELICVPFGIEPPIYRRRLLFFVKSRAFSIEKAKRILKYEPQHSFETEVRLLAAWYKEQKWL